MNELEQKQLPNATAVLVLGIISIITCCCYGIFGIIIGGIALFLFKLDKKVYDLNPGDYSNYSNLKTGGILAIIGIVLSLLFLIFIIFIFTVVGLDGLQNPELLKEKMNGW